MPVPTIRSRSPSHVTAFCVMTEISVAMLGELSENRPLSRQKSRDLTSPKGAPEKRRKWLKPAEPGLYADLRERVVYLGWSCRKPWKTGEKYEKRRAAQARRRGVAWRRPPICI